MGHRAERPEPRAHPARRPPAPHHRQRPRSRPRGAGLDHRPRPVGVQADCPLALAGRAAAWSPGSARAHGRLPQPVPPHLQHGLVPSGVGPWARSPNRRGERGLRAVTSSSRGAGPPVRRFGPSLLRLAAGVTVLWFIGQHVGAAPFKDGLRAVTWQAVVAAVTLTALTTVFSAWRWRVVARALGVGIGLPRAVGAYYRSLFLNSVLIGGGLGDVDRAVTHGRRAGDVAAGRRAVGWERLGGQVVQAVVTAIVLLTLTSPVRAALPYVLAGVAGIAGCAALVVRGAARRGQSRLTLAARAVSADLRHGLLAPDVWPQLALASVLVVAGHTVTFVIAARVAGCTAPLGELIALL